MNQQKISGYIMFGVGFAMLMVNALSYIFSWKTKSPAITIIGLVFVTISLKIARKSSK